MLFSWNLMFGVLYTHAKCGFFVLNPKKKLCIRILYFAVLYIGRAKKEVFYSVVFTYTLYINRVGYQAKTTTTTAQWWKINEIASRRIPATTTTTATAQKSGFTNIFFQPLKWYTQCSVYFQYFHNQWIVRSLVRFYSIRFIFRLSHTHTY